jgi:16S rRNA (adenine(1408)-N(1))-methyltransferase
VLLETAWKAARKPARGGVSNLLCIAEPLDVLAPALGAIADRVTVILPWGILLQAVAAPRKESLRDLAALCLPDAAIEIVLSYDERNDAKLDGQHMLESLPRLYEESGIRVIEVEKIDHRKLEQYETTWASRLGFGRSRDVWQVLARVASVR